MTESGEIFVITPQGDLWQLAHEIEGSEQFDEFPTLDEAKAKAQALAGENLTWRRLDGDAWEAVSEDKFS